MVESTPIKRPIGPRDYASILARAVREAQERSRRAGVPNVYVINGRIFFEAIDGSLTTTDPYVPSVGTASQ